MRITLTGGWWLVAGAGGFYLLLQIKLMYLKLNLGILVKTQMVEKMNLVTLFFNQYMVLSWNTVS